MASAIYYLDLVNGDDANTGLTMGQAWKTVSKAGAAQAGGTIGVFDSGIQVRVVANGGSGSSAGFYKAGSSGYGTTWVAVTEDDETWTDWDLSTDAGVAKLLAWAAARPTFDGGAATRICQMSHAITMIGIKLDNGREGATSSSSSADYEMRFEWCDFTNIDDEAITNLGDESYPGSRVWYCYFESIPKNSIRISTSDDDADISIRGNLLVGCGGPTSTSIMYLANGGGCVVEHNTFYGGVSVSAPAAIHCDSGVVQNNVIVDAAADYGVKCPTGIERNNCCYTSDAGTWHTSGGFEGGAGTGSITSDPQFADVGADDYTLAEGSPCIYTGTALATLTYDRVGVEYEDPPSMGAFAAPLLPSLQWVVRGSHLVLVRLADGFSWAVEAYEDAFWSVSGGSRERTPIVAEVEPVAGSAQDLYLRLDRSLRLGQTYTFDAAAGYADGYPDEAATDNLDGPRVSAPPEGAPAWQFADLAGLEVDDRADLALEGGVAVLQKVVRNTVLTTARSLFYAPEHGSQLQIKRLIPSDLDEAQTRIAEQLADIPFVEEARAVLYRRGVDHVLCEVYAATSLGAVELTEVL